MKKIIAIILIVLSLTIIISSCGDSTKDGENKDLTMTNIIDAIKEKTTVTDETIKAAEMIGAVEGKGFKVNDKSFELYRFDAEEKINEAKTGKFKFTIEGFGELEMKSSVNGNFVLLYEENDDDVINAFKSAK